MRGWTKSYGEVDSQFWTGRGPASKPFCCFSDEFGILWKVDGVAQWQVVRVVS